MSILSKLLSRAGLQPINKSSTDDTSSMILRAVNEETSMSTKTAMGQFKGWSYACIRAIAEEIANMQIQMMKIGADDMDEEIYDNDLLNLLDGVNASMTSFELKYLTATHLELTGNAYWYLDGCTTESSKPKAIYILKPDCIKQVKSVGFPQTVVEYKYIDGKIEKTFKPYEILHIKYPNPNNAFQGQGTIESISSWISSDNAASDFNNAFFKNSARPDAMLESESAISPDNMEYLRKSFESVYRGIKNAHKTLILPKGTTFKPVGFNQKDMDFIETLKDARDKILAGFRVPRTVLGLTDDVNRANADATNYVFALRTIKPKMQLIVTYLNEFLVPRYGTDVYLTFKNPVPEDRTTDISEMTAATGGKPVLTQNEAREKYFGYGEVDGGDTIESPSGGLLQLSRKKDMKNRKNLGPAKTRFAKNMDNRKSISKELAEKFKEIIKDVKVSEDKIMDDEAVWKARVDRVTPKENDIEKIIRKYNDDQMEKVLANVGEATKAINADDLFDSDKEVEILIDLMTPIMNEIAKEEGNVARREIGLPALEKLPKATHTAVATAMDLMARKYNETTINTLTAKLEQGIEDGYSLDKLKKSVRDVYEFSNDTRANMVARTESYRVANESTRLAWKESGVVKSVKWYTAQDELVCEFCGPMNGVIQPIDKGFFEEGDTVEGSDGGTLDTSYATVENPPLHVNCRCQIRPEEISINNAQENDDKEIEQLIKEIENEN